MATLHLHNKPDTELPQPADPVDGICETGAWYVSVARAASMVGADLHIHRNKTEPSFNAGTILDFERRNYSDPRDGKTKMRTYFKFRETPGKKGRTTGPEGWLQSGIKWIP
ncbi:hypothetical protein HZ994_15320 [Akkermansiaceae bacterium]|nr:hypothetical protein HZ994_15320 [Akkermansiaceae bacterium]